MLLVSLLGSLPSGKFGHLERWDLEAHKLGIYEIHLGPLDRSHPAYVPYVSDEGHEMQAPSKFGALACPQNIQVLQQKC